MATYKLRPYQQKLVDDARNAYADGFRAPCVVSPCGSGKSVVIAEIARITKGRVLFLVHRRELKEQIRNTFISSGVDMSRVEIGMVQTIVRRLERTEKPTLIITDEGHHGLASSYRKIYDYFSDARMLGFTATPIRLNGSGLGDVYDTLIAGPTVPELIAMGNLAPYKLYAPELIDRSALKKSHGEFTIKSIENTMGVHIYGDVIKNYRKLADRKKAICYCASVKNSQEVAEEFNRNSIPAEHIDGTTPQIQRDIIINGFRSGEIKILCNVDIVGEGFDVPDCEVSILLRPTKSLSLYIQQAMRCMRYMPDKLAIIIDHAGNCMEHGLPDTDRKWALDGITSQKQDRTASLRTCENCFAVWFPVNNRCPQCGYVNPMQETKITVDKSVELIEITNQPITVDFRNPSDCKNMKELYQLAKNRGYKPGWAYHQGKLMGYL